MRRKGFTLIELLAVIVILAVIALIAVPTVMNIINNAQKSAFKDSAYGIIKSGEMYYTNKMMDPDGMTEDKEFTFPDAEGLELKGSRPTSGTMVITKEGKMGLAIHNGRYCVKKGYDDEDVTTSETTNVSNCKIPRTLNPNISSADNCIKDTSTTCANGTFVEVQVNADTRYNFYVIKDTGEELTLIMDRNLGNRVAWNTSGNNTNGPLTALNYLEEQTSSWTNIPTMNYTLSDDGGGTKFGSITRTNVRARLLNYTESTSLGCTTSSGSCNHYLYTNLSSSNSVELPSGYWLSSASSYDSISAWDIEYGGNTFIEGVNAIMVAGIRPVMTISKTL